MRYSLLILLCREVTLALVFGATIDKGHSTTVSKLSTAEAYPNVCVNGVGYCDSTWLSYPNLNAALFGIDLPALNPNPEDFIVEPGVKNQLFQSTFREPYGSMGQYDFVQTVDELRCKASFDQYWFRSFEETLSYWSQFQSTGQSLQIGHEVEVSAEVDGIGAKSVIPPAFTRSKSSEHSTSNMEAHFSQEMGSVAHSRAECSIYKVSVDIQAPTLKFYSGFEHAILRLDSVARNGTDHQKKTAGENFIGQYGTHYADETIMGSYFSFETRYTYEETRDNSVSTLKGCNTKSGAALFGMNHKSKTTCYGSLDDTTSGADTAVKRFVQTTVGSFPAGSQNISEWSQQLQDMAKAGTLTPSPIRRKMGLIFQLFNTEVAKRLEHQDGPYKGKRIDVNQILEVLLPAYVAYCVAMSGTNCHIGCKRAILLTKHTDSYELRLANFSYNGRAVYCTESFECLYYSNDKWHFGPEVGNIPSSIFVSSNCPQVGGEFVGREDLEHSPAFGINSWHTCAGMCQSRPGCLHWQYDTKTKKCYSVSDFHDWSPNDDYIAGARNCPMDASTESLLSLCPDNSEISHMFQLPGDGLFYERDMNLGKRCPESTNSSGDSWTILENGKCYLAERTGMTRTTAKSWCEDHGGFLARIKTPEDSITVWQQSNKLGFGTNSGVWIGVRKYNGEWKWDSNEEALWQNWHTGEPNGSGDCAYARSCYTDYCMDWYDEPCSSHWWFLCEA